MTKLQIAVKYLEEAVIKWERYYGYIQGGDTCPINYDNSYDDIKLFIERNKK